MVRLCLSVLFLIALLVHCTNDGRVKPLWFEGYDPGCQATRCGLSILASGAASWPRSNFHVKGSIPVVDSQRPMMYSR